MNHISRSAGVALAVYALCTTAAFMASGAPGGSYSDAMVTDYLSSSHLPVAASLWYVGALGALSLLVVANGLSALPGAGRLLAGLCTVGAATSLVGAFISAGVVVATAEGGSVVHDGVSHPVVYTFTEIGNLLAVAGPALCVGVGALVLAARAPFPGWLRVFSVVAGICGILAPFFFTYFVFVLWTLVAGAAIAARRVSPVTPPQPATSLV